VPTRLAGAPLPTRRGLVARAIESAALRLFAERGFDAVAVDEVAAAVGISQRTFFRYFASKDDVVLGYSRRLDERLVIALEGRPASEGAVTALRQAFLTTSTIEPADRDDVLLRARAVAGAPVLRARSRGEAAGRVDRLAVLLAHRMRMPSDDLRPRTVAAAMSATAIAAFEQWVADPVGQPADRIAEALDLVQRGLAELDP
jgi:AcrR family transcriptional regulator